MTLILAFVHIAKLDLRQELRLIGSKDVEPDLRHVTTLQLGLRVVAIAAAAILIDHLAVMLRAFMKCSACVEGRCQVDDLDLVL